MTLKYLLKYLPDLKIILVVLLYYASARLGYFLAFENTAALPAWPPSGMAFALIILLGRSSWPGITIGALIANIMAYWNQQSLQPQVIIAVSSFIAIGHTLEALVGNFLINKWVEDRFPFSTTKNAFRFLFVALIMCLIGASAGTTTLYFNGVIQSEEVLRTAFSWWVGNVVGILLFTPFVLSLARKHVMRFSTEKIVESGIFLSGIIAILFLLNVDYLHDTLQHALPFLLLPFLLWLAFRFELTVAIAGVLAASIVSIYYTTSHVGPFVLLGGDNNSMLLLQIFIGVISISTIVLSATVRERAEAQQALQEFNESLEGKILARTSELNEEIHNRKQTEENLQRANQELSKRNTELDNFVYSVSHDLRAPIASVLGLTNLAKKDLDVVMKDIYLDKIHSSAVLQDDFIKEILDQSRNSRLEIRREEIRFQPLIEDTFDQLKFATSTGKSVEKIVTVNQNTPFYCDQWRLKVILNNIISNSIRYRNGKDPVIKINVDVSDRVAKLEIRDNGKGIAKEHLDKVCKMFYRATDDGAGSGLGLYIVKEAIDKLHGFIRIDSEVGKGTTVTLEIPEVIDVVAIK